MITSSFSLTATERVLPKLALDFTTANLDSRVTFTRTTNATNPATYTNSSGVLTLATNNQPRFDYDPVTLACKGLLIEESRTNLLLNSLIDGTTLSTQIVTTAATPYTLSFYGTGTITLSGTATDVVSGIGVYPSRKTYTFTPTAGALTCTVTGTVQFAQLEAGAFATSYIPTTTTALTRNADVATMTGTNFSDWYNATQGSFQASFDTLGRSAANFVLVASDNTTSNRIQTYCDTTNVGGYMVGGVSSANPVVANSTNNTVIYSCFGYKNNNSDIGVNTALGTNNTTATVPSGLNRLYLGSNFNGGGNFLNGHLRKVSYYTQRLIQSELRAFSKG